MKASKVKSLKPGDTMTPDDGANLYVVLTTPVRCPASGCEWMLMFDTDRGPLVYGPETPVSVI